jgi:hypothetical protein
MSDGTHTLRAAYTVASQLRQAVQDWQAHLGAALAADARRDAAGRAGALFKARDAARLIDELIAGRQVSTALEATDLVGRPEDGTRAAM